MTRAPAPGAAHEHEDQQPRAGFHRVGERRPPADDRLPARYHGITVAPLERACDGPVG